MRTRDIRQWLQAARDAELGAPNDAEGDATHESGASTSAPPDGDDWAAYQQHVAAVLRSPKTKRRLAFLRECVPLVAQDDATTTDERMDLYRLLVDVSMLHQDRASRLALWDAGDLLLQADAPAGAPLDSELVCAAISLLRSQTEARVTPQGAISGPRGELVALHAWLTRLLAVVLQADEAHLRASQSFPPLVDALALVHLGVRASHPTTHADRQLPGALHAIWRALRSAPTHLSLVLEYALDLPAAHAWASLVLQGCVLDVATHLKTHAADAAACVSGARQRVLASYTTHVVSAKAPVAPCVVRALDLYFAKHVSQSDLDAEVMPVLPKMMLRTPEMALDAATAICAAAPIDGAAVLAKVQAPLLSAVVSGQATTRRAALALARALLPRCDDTGAFVTALCASIKPTDTRSEEQRASQCALLQLVPPSASSSVALLNAMAPIVQKEVQPAPLSLELDALWPHWTFLLEHDTREPAPMHQALVAKLSSPKAPLRTAALTSLGGASALAEARTPAAHALWADLVGVLGKCVATALAAPLPSPDAATDGAVAVALLWGPLSAASSALADAAPKHAPLEPLLQLGAKPSFLVNDKAARKLREHGTLAWHAKALHAALSHRGWMHLHDAELQAALERQLAVYLPGAPDAGFALLADVATHDARLAHKLVRALVAEPTDWAPHTLRRMLHTLVGPDEQRADLLPELIVLAHAAAVLEVEEDAFVHLCRLAQQDPAALVARHADRILATIYAAEATVWAPAARRALATAVFIAPDALAGRVCGDVTRDTSVRPVEAYSDEDMAIFATPAGQCYVDVLAQAAPAATLDKGRASNMDKWDAEVRASIAAKKKASEPATLTKKEQAAVDAQLAKEAEIRGRVQHSADRMRAALERVPSVCRGAPDMAAYLFPLTVATLRCVQSPRVRSLGLGAPAAAALEALAQCCEPRARRVATFVAYMMLRAADEALVPLDYALESLEAMELRVLYQLRLLVGAAPLDLATCSFLMPWMTQLVHRSRLTGDDDADDGVVERLHLALDFFAAHSAYGQQPTYPRAEVLHALLALLRRVPMLASDAVGALRAYGESIARERQGEGALVHLLLAACLSDERRERDGALQCLSPLDLTELEFPAPLFLATHAPEEAALATRIWDENALDVPPTYAPALLPLLQHEHEYVRTAAAAALGDACAQHPATLPELMDALEALYAAENKDLAPEYDEFGLVKDATLHREDPWRVRLAVAQTLQALAPLMPAARVLPWFRFALQAGYALSDRDERVRSAMLSASVAMLDAQDMGVLQELATLLEARVESDDDAVTEAAIVLLGRAARHWDPSDAYVRRVVERLVHALRTPSELVQEAVASCLPELVRTAAVAPDVPALVDDLFHDLLRGAKYATRRGAAYGLAAVVLGRGVSCIRSLRVLERLDDAVRDTSASTLRQGAMFAYEIMANMMRVLLEPYVDGILAHLLLCFGDTHADVREATQDAARVLMRSLSGPCLKSVLPSLLAGLDDKAWRTKKGAVELLGAMAFCAPRQLSQALPTVIPRLSEVLTDSHRQVSAAANQSLKQFGEVIHNPEIHKLVPTLLKALVDPNAKTAAALKALLHTKFVHYIDAPSLALIAPIIERGLRERSVAAQRQSAQIVGHLASLTDARDYVPYLARYTPLIRVVLVSPVPDARATAAHALGTLVERLGEVHFQDLIPSLLHVLQTDATGVDRHGAAQGLAEVLAGLGLERMERLLPSIVENTQASASYVREGHLALLIYLPATFGPRFVPYLGRIVSPIVSSMADEIESVREASLRAGRMLIANYTQRSVDLLLPQMEPRLFDDRHRVRLSALQLTSDLLLRVGGITSKAGADDDAADDDDEDEEANVAASSVQRALTAALGTERRSRLLAALYILRQDPSIPVRQAAAQTWKALVHNTPRTAREVLAVMLDLVLELLAAEGDEQREMAGRTLGELVRKLGEKILAEAVPLLADRAAHAPRAKTRAGVCRAVTDLLANATKTQLEDHQGALIDMVRHALSDDDDEVRAAAAHALDAMQAHLGHGAIDATVPTLLSALDDDAKSATALAALKEVVRTQPDAVVPVVLPALVRAPISPSHAHALVEVLPVTGDALAPHVAAVLGGVAASCAPNDPDAEPVLGVADALFASLHHVDALHQAMVQLLGWLSHRTPERRTLGCQLLVRFAAHTPMPWDDYTIDYLRKLVSLFADDAEDVRAAALAALHACVQSVHKDEWGTLVVPLRRALETTGAPQQPLAGLCQPRGAGPFVPVLLHGLLQGTAEQREQGALGLAELVEKSTPDSIKPFITSMVGPLIRLCGDRHAPPVKSAILTSLDAMVHQVPALVRPFYPQLQRSFQKALSDPASGTVRAKAAHALGFLMGLQQRVEGVVQELVHTLHQAFDGAHDDTAEAHAVALAVILEHVDPAKLGDSARASLVSCMQAAFHANEEPSESLKKALAELCAALLRFDAERLRDLLAVEVLQPAPVDVQLAALCVRACVETAPAQLYEVAAPPSIVAQLAGAWLNEAPSVARPARETREKLRRTMPWQADESVQAAL